MSTTRRRNLLIALCALLAVAALLYLVLRAAKEQAAPPGGAVRTPIPGTPLPEGWQTPALRPPVLLAGPYLGEVTGSTVTILWVTSRPGPFVVRYGLPGLPPDESVPTSTISPVGWWHSATLDELEPGTTYRYAILMGHRVEPITSERSVTTAPPPSTDHFTFMVLGDSRPGDRVYGFPSSGAQKVAALVATEHFSLALHTGDIVADGGVCSGVLNGWEQYLRSYFGLYGETLARAPFYLTPGNHEFIGGSCGDEIYKAVYALPRNASPGDEEEYYSFDWGNAHFTVLNSYARLTIGSAQYQWLERDLASTEQRWKFVMFHHPVYSSGEHGPLLMAQGTWVPLFEQYGVDVVFAGHDHIYERTCPILKGVCSTEEKGGVVYFVTGGGGAGLYDTTGGWFSRARASLNHYMMVEVRDCALYVTVTDRDGNVIDRYELDRCG